MGKSECLNKNFRPSRSIKTQNFNHHGRGVYSAPSAPSWSEITNVFIFVFIFCISGFL